MMTRNKSKKEVLKALTSLIKDKKELDYYTTILTSLMDEFKDVPLLNLIKNKQDTLNIIVCFETFLFIIPYAKKELHLIFLINLPADLASIYSLRLYSKLYNVDLHLHLSGLFYPDKNNLGFSIISGDKVKLFAELCFLDSANLPIMDYNISTKIH